MLVKKKKVGSHQHDQGFLRNEENGRKVEGKKTNQIGGGKYIQVEAFEEVYLSPPKSLAHHWH